MPWKPLILKKVVMWWLVTAGLRILCQYGTISYDPRPTTLLRHGGLTTEWELNARGLVVSNAGLQGPPGLAWRAPAGTYDTQRFWPTWSQLDQHPNFYQFNLPYAFVIAVSIGFAAVCWWRMVRWNKKSVEPPKP